jgi:hypothetical protein
VTRVNKKDYCDCCKIKKDVVLFKEEQLLCEDCFNAIQRGEIMVWTVTDEDLDKLPKL